MCIIMYDIELSISYSKKKSYNKRNKRVRERKSECVLKTDIWDRRTDLAESFHENENKNMLMKSRFLAYCIICIQWILLVALFIVQKQFILFLAFDFILYYYPGVRSIWSVDFLHLESLLCTFLMLIIHTYCSSECVCAYVLARVRLFPHIRILNTICMCVHSNVCSFMFIYLLFLREWKQKSNWIWLDFVFLLFFSKYKLAKRIYIATFKSLNTKIIANDEMHKFYKQKVLKEEDEVVQRKSERDSERQKKAETTITIE